MRKIALLPSLLAAASLSLVALAPACGGDDPGATGDGGSSSEGGGGGGGGGGNPEGGGGGGTEPPKASCSPGTGGTPVVAAPKVVASLEAAGENGWLGSPAVVDLDGDGKNEIVVTRNSDVVVYGADGKQKWTARAGGGRIWSSAVVANLAGDTKLEIAVAARDRVFVFDAAGQAVSGFPVTFTDEMRALAAGDLDGDGKADIVATTGRSNPPDVVAAWKGDGTRVAGFPPQASGTSGCTGRNAPSPCYLAGAYDQNLAIADLDGDGKQDVVVPHDNAYASFHKGTGEAFDCAAYYEDKKKTPGVRYLHDLAEAKQGYSDSEDTSLQAHFTNTAPAIADVDEDGTLDIVMLGSVQNAAQSNRRLGVGLWVVHSDASRAPGWEVPFHVREYLGGLEDLGGNLVGETNQVAIADIAPAEKGKEIVFAGFDGKIHAVTAAKKELWATAFTTDPAVFTTGVAVADLSGDGAPEIVFATYGGQGKVALFVLDANGKKLHELPLPGRGAMSVPTIADVDGDGKLEILVSLKDPAGAAEVQIYGVDTAQTNCVLWATGRGSFTRNAWVR